MTAGISSCSASEGSRSWRWPSLRSRSPAAAAAALLADDQDNVAYELGGPAFSFEELASTISEVTAKTVVYRDLPSSDYLAVLQQIGLDEATAEFVVAIDASIAAGDLETDSDDLARLLGRQPTPLAETFRIALASQ